MSLRTPSRRARAFLWSAAAAGFGLCPLDLLRAQETPRPGMLFGLGRDARALVAGRDADVDAAIRPASAGHRADGAVKPGSMRPLGAPRPLFDGTAPVGRPIESAGPVPTAPAARPAVPTVAGAAFPGPRPIQQTTGQLAPTGAPGAVPAHHAPAPQHGFPQQTVAQQAAPESEVMRQLRLRYAQEGREMPAMDPAAVTPSVVMPAAPQMAPVRNPGPDIHRNESVASRPNFLQRMLPFGKRKPTPAAAPMPPQAPPAQYPSPYVATQPTMPQRPAAPQPMIAPQHPAPQQVYIPPSATPAQAATPAPIVRPATSPSAPPAQFAPQTPTRMATAPAQNAPAQVAAPQVAPTAPAPVATAPAAVVAQPTPVAAPAAQVARPIPQTPSAPVAAAPASAPATPEFRMILDAPAQAQAAPMPIAAPAATSEPEATAATEPAPNATGEEFPDPFTEVSEEQADAPQKSPFTGRRLDPSAAPTIQPARTAAAEPARTASTEPARMTEPAATPAPLPAAAPQPIAAPQSVAQSEPAAKPAGQPTPPSADERQSKLQKIAARQDRKGLKGFCPVSLRDGRDLVDTLPEFSSVFESRLYYFSSSEAKAKFDQNPTRYAPVAGGSDVILMHETGSEVEGRLDHALWYQDRLFLFSSRDTLGRFVKHLADERAAASANDNAGDADEDDKD